ncbi:MAG: hypothetical protein V1896_01805 [Candidatus Zambryskibacteria bacterium]
MKFNFLKFKKKSMPTLKSLRPKTFDADTLWFASLGLFLIIFVITGFVGFRLFYSQYFESYKETNSSENFKDIINIDRLKNAIEKRNEFINQQISIPRDPSF